MSRPGTNTAVQRNNKVPRILLLDDESEIVDLCARVLRTSYLVVKTSSPFEALSFMDSGRTKIDLVVCDYSMPGMDGGEFATRIRELGIKTPVVLYTGLALSPKEHHLDRFAKILQKPFDSQTLRDAVSSVLTGAEDHAVPKSSIGIKPQLGMAMENLQIYLEHRGICDPASIGPENAMKILGPGEDYTIYLSWLSLYELSQKIEG